MGRQLIDHFVNPKDVRILAARGQTFGERNSDQIAPTFRGGSSARRFDENAAHGLGGSGEEVPAAVELLIADQPQVRLVDEGRGVEGVAGPSPAILAAASFPQLVVDERQEGRRRPGGHPPGRRQGGWSNQTFGGFTGSRFGQP